VIQSLEQESWSEWTTALHDAQVDLALPKFELSYEIALKDVLSSLGMGIAFIPSEADFTRMYNGPNDLYISKVRHKTFVKVNEEGTEAAAATSVDVGVTSVPQFVQFKVDRPFVFIIRENHSGAIMFMGKIYDPSNS
jgi:serpin B